MAPIIPHGYVCRHTDTPIVVDGKLDDAAWASVPWTEDSVDIQGVAMPKPRFHTHVKMLWDDDYLYIAAELEEPHVWATLTNHDSVIFLDPDFEVFIDPQGNTHNYYEFEMNALNTSWDLMLDKPYMDQGKPNNAWDIPGLKTAVQVDGTINNASDSDKGWTLEIAFPWKVLAEHARHSGPPTEGEQWRIDFSRVEWQITTTGGVYAKVPDTREDNWIWSPPGVIDMHRPEMWGLLQFTRQPASQEISVTPIPGKPARDLALEVYYAQRDFRKENHRWATNTSELAIQTASLPSGVEAPMIESTTDGYVCSVKYNEDQKPHVWRIRQDRLLKLDEPLPVEGDAFLSEAVEKFGDAGRRAAYFILDNMPASDHAALSSDFLMENLSLAMQARTNFPWAKAIPERMYFNDVLPYASLDEPRDPWRADFYPMCSNIVRDCKTATEAAQALNRELFNQVKVHYNLKRKRNNQSPKESIEQGKATCTGLSIILVDACRAVGVPARIAGVPEWAQKEGNHTWAEIWDGDWFFTGADEYDKNGLNRAWFNSDAAITVRNTNALHQIYATSWRKTGEYFPLSWDLASRDVAGVNDSARYVKLIVDTNETATTVHVRLRDKEKGERLLSDVQLRTESDQLLSTNHTRAGTADMNDMPDFVLPDFGQAVLRFSHDGQTKEMTVECSSCVDRETLDVAWNELTPVPQQVLKAESWLAHPATDRGAPPDFTFSRDDAKRIISMAWADVAKTRAASASQELSADKITIGDKELKWMEKTFGDARDGKHSLWITLHGGGNAPAEENDKNWKGYYGRYEFPPGSINVAPRSPANSWDMWFIPEVDGLFDRLISDMVMQRGVDPNRVYIIGYSAGGDGVYQLAPRLADRFAAATMCAGHPNDQTPEGLRNLPFFLYMGGADDAYNRNQVVVEYSAKIDALQATDPAGYTHRLTVYPGLPHGMQNREAETIPRMAALARDTWPKRVVWKQSGHGILHTQFYWLERPADDIKANEIYAARADGQTITIETPDTGKMTLRLSDGLLDLGKPVRVVASGKTVFEGSVPR